MAKTLFIFVLFSLVGSSKDLSQFEWTEQPCLPMLSRLARTLLEREAPLYLPELTPYLNKDGQWVLKVDRAAVLEDYFLLKENRIDIEPVTRGGVVHLYYRQVGFTVTPNMLKRIEKTGRLQLVLSHRPLEGTYNFVILKNGTFRLGKRHSETGVATPHPCLIGGYLEEIEALGAGELTFINGYLRTFNLRSGHLKPAENLADQIDTHINRVFF